MSIKALFVGGGLTTFCRTGQVGWWGGDHILQKKDLQEFYRSIFSSGVFTGVFFSSNFIEVNCRRTGQVGWWGEDPISQKNFIGILQKWTCSNLAVKIFSMKGSDWFYHYLHAALKDYWSLAPKVLLEDRWPLYDYNHPSRSVCKNLRKNWTGLSWHQDDLKRTKMNWIWTMMSYDRKTRWQKDRKKERQKKQKLVKVIIIDWVSNKLCNKYFHQLHEMKLRKMNKWYDLSVNMHLNS